MQSLACFLSFIHIFKKSILQKKSHREKFKYSMVIFSFETFGSKEIDVAHCPEFFFPHCVACSSPMKDQTWTVGGESPVLTTGPSGNSYLKFFNVYFYKEKLLPETFWENYMEFFQSFIMEFIKYIQEEQCLSYL